MTSSPLLSYATLTRLFGPEEARRCVALEQYSIDWIIETCEREGWTEEVELRKGGGNVRSRLSIILTLSNESADHTNDTSYSYISLTMKNKHDISSSNLMPLGRQVRTSMDSNG